MLKIGIGILIIVFIVAFIWGNRWKSKTKNLNNDNNKKARRKEPLIIYSEPKIINEKKDEGKPIDSSKKPRTKTKPKLDRGKTKVKPSVLKKAKRSKVKPSELSEPINIVESSVKFLDIKLGTYIDDILCESVFDEKANKIRVRPLSGQGLPKEMNIQCSKSIRNKYPVGTKFRTDDVKVCKAYGAFYLRARDQMIYKI